MKNLFKSFVVGALLLGSVGCSDMFKEDLYEINNEIDKINQRIDSLCNAVNTNIASLQTIIDVMQDNDYVDSITPIVENGVTIGYEIVFTQSGSVKIYHGEKGETGATGHSPVVGVKQAEDGRWYWTIDGEWMVNAEGKKILAEAIDGEDGAPGADGIPGIDGITPKLKVQDNYWYISYDNGTTWERLGKATGEAGTDGDSMFQSVNYNEDYVELVLVDGTVLTIPTWASHMLLVDEIAKINNNISAIQAAVKALESNDYVQKVTPVEDKEGNVIGYTLQFAFTGDVTIYHGEDGEKGEDGHTPVIGVKQFNGEWYWTIDGEWLVDGNGEMVPTSGEDGAEGAEGQAGITPELKIEDDYWYVSYDKGGSWTKLGKAKGEDGAAGGDGAAGDAFFEDVDTSDEYYIILTLADGTEIKIPTWKAHQALADAVSHLNTNVTSLQAIITGIQNNDFVTGTTEIVDPQTNEVIGYKLHFSKSGDIEIYHGKTPNAPEIGIRKHPQYGLCWTYDGEYIKDPSTGKPVALPKDGANAIAPKFMIENGMWYMSTDDGRTWQEIGQATGDQGETGATGGAGDSFFKSIVPEYAKDDKGNVLKDELGRPIVAYIVMTLAGENEGEDVVYKVPTEYVTSELTKRIAAIEAQFTTISTIVNALQKAEYIKEVVELTEGLNVVGYEITFVKYTLNPDGTLSETIRKSTIRNGAGGAAGTVVDAEYDEKTGIWYWTLDGKPLIDEETGEVVPINGQAGVTPQMRINPETNFWEISYDNGNTWESTDVKATGPQGTPGQGGAAGDSFFVDVYKSSDGKFWIFERTEGEAIKVPTAEAFAALQNEVGLIKSNLNVIASAINGSKYITDFKERKDANGNVVGFDANLITYVLSYDETSGAYTFSTTDTEKIQYTANDVVTLIKKEDGYYWHIATGTSEDGTTSYIDVKVDGADWVPSVVLHADGNIYISKVSGHDESTLAADLAATGWEQYWIKIDTSKTTDTNTYSKVENILGADGKTVVGYRITFAEGQVIEVPTKAGFDALVNDVNGLKSNVLALNDFVNGNSYIADYEPIVENGKTVAHHANLVQYTITEGEDGNWVVSDPTKSHITFRYDCTVTVVNKGTEDVPVWEWVVNGEETGIPMEGWVPEVVLHTDNNIYISKVSGHDESTLAADIERGDWAKYWIQIDTSKTQDTNTFATVTGDEKTGYEITFADGTKISVPSMDQFASLVLEVRDLQNNIKALNNFVNSNSYIADYEPIVENGKTVGFKAKQVEYTIVKGEDGNYTTSVSKTTPIEFKYACMVTVVDKGTETAPSWEWVVNGQETGIPMDGSDWVPAVVLHTDNNIYISKANGHDANTLAKDLTEDGWEQYWIKIDTSKTQDTNTFATVTGSETEGWQITFPPVGDATVGQTIHVPSYKQYEDLLEKVNTIKDNVDAINRFMNGQSYLTDYEEIEKGFTATLVEYTITTDEKGNYVTSSKTETPITFQYDCMVTVADGKWVINGEPTDIPVDGRDWVPTILLHEGMVYVSTNTERTSTLDDLKADIAADTVEENWIVINPNDTDTKPGEDNNDFATVTGSEDEGWQITFPPVGDATVGQTIHVPSYKQYEDLLKKVNTIKDNVDAINGFMNGQSYLTDYEEIEKGFTATLVEYTITTDEKGNYVTSSKTETPITFQYDCMVTVADGKWVINGEPTDIPVDGRDWVPTILLHEGMVYVSTNTKRTSTLEDLKADIAAGKVEENWIVINPNDTDTKPGNDNFATVTGSEDEGWQITFPPVGDATVGQTIHVPSYTQFLDVLDRLDDVESTVAGLQPLLDGNTFITGITPNPDGSGFSFTYKTVGEGGVLSEEKEESVSFNGLVTPNATGDGFTVSGYEGELSWKLDPKFEIHEGVLQMSIDGGKTWVDVLALADSNNYGRIVSVTEPVDGVDVVVAYEIYFPDPTDLTKEVGPYKVLSWAGYELLADRVDALESTVAGLQPLLDGNTFITGITPNPDGSGFSFTYKTVGEGGVLSEEKEESVSFNGLVTPNATGDGFTVSGYEGELNWKHDLKFVIENGVIKFSIDGGKTWAEVTLPVDKNTNNFGRTEEILEKIGSTNIVTGYKIYFPDPKDPTKEVGPYEVRKWFTTPVITFGTDGTLDLGTASSATVTCTITGSFTSAPVIYTNCEGNFTSTASAVTGSGNTYTATITVRPTTAYAGDDMSGKLTVYCPYYGNTGIGQINLAATGSGELVLQSTSTEPMTILEKPANNATASITFRLEGEDAPPSSGLPVIIDNNYTLTDVQNVLTNNGTKDVETGNGFSASLDYAGTEGWITLGDCNYDAATKKFTQHFTLDDNTSTESPRTGAVVVFSPSRREVARFIIKQEPATPPTIIDATNLAVGQSANCYIISKPGRYELPAYKGVHKDLTTAPKCTGKPYEVWNDSGNTINFLQANFSDNKIIFDVNSVNNGNALIAVRDKNNKILWSWHLWFCADGEPATETYPTSSENMMDRNIGAAAQGEESKLYYQGGRKDPLYPSNSLYSSASGGNMELAIANPSTFYKGWASSGWAAAKSQHDPCPPGYKIPSTSVWAKEKSEINRLTNMTNDAFLYNAVQPTIIYPYSGYLDANGTMADGMTGGITDKTSSTNIYSPTWAMTTMVNDPDLSRSPRRFRNVTYKLHDLRIFGGVWAEGNSALDYGYGSFGFELVSYSYDVGTYKKLYGSLYRVTWSNSWKDVSNVALGQNGLDQTALNDIYQILNIVNFASTLTTELTYDKGTKSANLGYQVRCVAE